MNPTNLHPAFAGQLLHERHLDALRDADARRLERAVRRSATSAAARSRAANGPSGLTGFLAGLARRATAHA